MGLGQRATESLVSSSAEDKHMLMTKTGQFIDSLLRSILFGTRGVAGRTTQQDVRSIPKGLPTLFVPESGLRKHLLGEGEGSEKQRFLFASGSGPIPVFPLGFGEAPSEACGERPSFGRPWWSDREGRRVLFATGV